MRPAIRKSSHKIRNQGRKDSDKKKENFFHAFTSKKKLMRTLEKEERNGREKNYSKICSKKEKLHDTFHLVKMRMPLWLSFQLGDYPPDMNT